MAHLTLDFQEGKNIGNVTLGYGGYRGKGGHVRSRLENGIWYWSFYESSQLKWSLTSTGGLKKDAEIFKSFPMDGTYEPVRVKNRVYLTHKTLAGGGNLVYTFDFAKEKDAETFYRGASQ